MSLQDEGHDRNERSAYATEPNRASSAGFLGGRQHHRHAWLPCACVAVRAQPRKGMHFEHREQQQ